MGGKSGKVSGKIKIFERYDGKIYKSEFELKNRRSTARVGILLSLVLTLDVFCTHESLTSLTGGKNLIFENMVVKFENLENVTGK